MPRAYDKGSEYGVLVVEREINAFRRRWPASGLDGLRNLYAAFDRRNGDLTELQCNRRHGDCHDYDGDALKALVDDAQCWTEAKFGIDTGRGCAARPDWQEYLGKPGRLDRE